MAIDTKFCTYENIPLYGIFHAVPGPINIRMDGDDVITELT